MKKILAFVKANLLSVICIAVTIISLPVLIFLGAGKASAIQEEVQGDLDGKNRTLQQVEFQYQFEPVTPEMAPVEIRRAPTKAMNEAMKSWGEQLRAQSAESIELIVDRNSEDHRVLLEGLFPEPAEPERVSKLQQVVELWPNAHRALIERVGAGAPPDAETLRAKLNIAWRQRVENIRSTRGVEPGVEDLEQIRASLREMRLSEYRAAASELRFYVDPGAFVDVEAWSQNSLPDMSTVWDWQWKHWIHADLLRALALANTEGQWERSLLEGPVKRLNGVSVSRMQFSGETQRTPIEYVTDIAPNWSASETGRSGWPAAQQGLYDVRYATINVMIDGARLKQVIEAIAATNLMRVVQVDLRDADPSLDLYEGFIYGGGRIVQAEFVIETVWLRSWTRDYMPPAVKRAMGVPEPVSEDESIEDEQG